jgi:hypothetical protein
MKKKLPDMSPSDPRRRLPEHEMVDRAARVFPDQKGEPVKHGDYETTKKDRSE